MAVEIRETPIGGRLRDFLDVVDYIYRDDPCFVRPLDLDMTERLSRKNPFFEHGDGVVFTAHRNNWCVGRCTAQIDYLHLRRHDDDAGYFGFLDTIDDLEVASELLGAAARWLKVRGMKRMRGPFMLSMNDMVGCLVEGFDTPPMILMPHHRPYQGALIEKAGVPKLKDAYAWTYTVGDIPKRAQKAHDAVAAMPEVRVRPVDPKHAERDIRVIMEIHNDAWAETWGFVPFTAAELTKVNKDLRLILDPRIALICEIEGQPAGVAFAIPNVNELIQDLNGKLFPTGLAKLWWRLKFAPPKTARLIILGIAKRFRTMKKYGALSTYIYVEMNECGKRAGYQRSELSYTLEDNHPVNLGIKFMGGKLYKRFRLYERAL